MVSAIDVVKDGPHRARVDLSRARVLPPHRDPASFSQRTDLLVLVVPGGVHGGSTYVFPIERIGTDVCEIRCNEPLALRERLQRVEIIGDRRLLRRASAEVLEATPWYLPDGSQTFRCRLSLDEEPPSTVYAETGPHDLVTEANEVRRLIDLAGNLQCEGWYEAPGWGRGTMRLIEVGKDSMSIELAQEPTKDGVRGRSVRLGFELLAIAYEIVVRVLARIGECLSLALPLILRRRRRHRRDHRVTVGPSHAVTLSFRNPVSGAVHTNPVKELSFFAVSFESASDQVLWKGLPLEQAQLSWGDRLIHIGDLLVDEQAYDQRSDATRCVASIQLASVADDEDMIALLATLAHPNVHLHDGANFSALHEIYLQADLFGPHMHRNLEPILAQTQDVWRRLHTDASAVARTFVRGPEHAPDAAATVLRAWEHAWIPQHYVEIRHESGSATGDLQVAYLDHIVPRADGRYLVFFVKTDNHAMNGYLKRFFSSVGTPDAVTKSVMELWSGMVSSIESTASPVGVVVRRLEAYDEPIVARAVERVLGQSAAAALSIVPGEMDLPDCRERFAAASLERSRECWVVTRDGTILYAVLEERTTPGVNLTWMLNATWILPVHPELDQDHGALDAALDFIVQRPAQTPTGERFLNLPRGLDPACMERRGFTKEASLFLYVLSRAGLHRVLNFAVQRHGEVDAVIARRERRREGRTSERSGR